MTRRKSSVSALALALFFFVASHVPGNVAARRAKPLVPKPARAKVCEQARWNMVMWILSAVQFAKLNNKNSADFFKHTAQAFAKTWALPGGKRRLPALIKGIVLNYQTVPYAKVQVSSLSAKQAVIVISKWWEGFAVKMRMRHFGLTAADLRSADRLLWSIIGRKLGFKVTARTLSNGSTLLAFKSR